MTHRYPFSAIHPSDYYGQRVAAYFNLHYKVFSIKESKNGNGNGSVRQGEVVYLESSRRPKKRKGGR
jgi:hypothetical protein